MCGVAPVLHPKLKRCKVVNERLDMPEASKGSYTRSNSSARFVLCEHVHDCAALRSPAVISFPPRQCTTHHLSAGDELRDQTSFCDPLGLVLYSADWLLSCVTKRGPAVGMRTHVRAAEADRPFRVAPVSRWWLFGLKYRCRMTGRGSRLANHYCYLEQTASPRQTSS